MLLDDQQWLLRFFEARQDSAELPADKWPVQSGSRKAAKAHKVQCKLSLRFVIQPVERKLTTECYGPKDQLGWSLGLFVPPTNEHFGFE